MQLIGGLILFAVNFIKLFYISSPAEFNSSRSRHRYRLIRNLKRFDSFCIAANITVHPLYAYENVIDEFPFNSATPVIGDETTANAVTSLCECEKRVMHQCARDLMHAT